MDNTWFWLTLFMGWTVLSMAPAYVIGWQRGWNRGFKDYKSTGDLEGLQKYMRNIW